MQLDGLTLFGLLSLGAMLVFYALEHRSHWYVLAMAGACSPRQSMASFRALGPLAFSS
jgi:hypothetical protein